MNQEHYVTKSLELHLFFGRIMKEHSLFLLAGFTPANPTFSKQAKYYMEGFEKLLKQVVNLSNGVVSRRVLRSGDVITEFTPLAEKQTEGLTGISIDKSITAAQQRMQGRSGQIRICSDKFRQVKKLNQEALKLLEGLICLKETILQKVSRGEMFTMNYPLLIEHILREAKLYQKYVAMLEENGELPDESMKEIESFWNRIMMEHAMFIRGLLDPSEEALFDSADEFAQDYAELLQRCRCAQDQAMGSESLEMTRKFRDFKAAGAKGIQKCEIRSIILPLLADHVLREANHYIRLMNQ